MLKPPVYTAQILRLDNTKHGDIEVILECDTFSELELLLINPKKHLRQLGKRWIQFDPDTGDTLKWKMLKPITVLLGTEKSGIGTHGPLHFLPIGNRAISITGDGESLPDGHWVALFSLNTHLVRVHYKVPADVAANILDVKHDFTLPNIFYKNVDMGDGKYQKRGTIHFDLTITDPNQVNKERARFVMNHLLDAQCSTCDRLLPNPEEKELGTGDTMGSVLPVLCGKQTMIERQYKKTPHLEPIVIMEGLSMPFKPVKSRSGLVALDDPGPPLACSQTGCVWVEQVGNVPAHWELDHMVVKNYVAPQGGG